MSDVPLNQVSMPVGIRKVPLEFHGRSQSNIELEERCADNCEHLPWLVSSCVRREHTYCFQKVTAVLIFISENLKQRNREAHIQINYASLSFI